MIRDHDNRDNNIQKVRNSLLQSRQRGIQEGNINWEGRCVTATAAPAVDTNKADNARLGLAIFCGPRRGAQKPGVQRTNMIRVSL